MLFKKPKIKKVHDEELFVCPRCNIKMEKLKKNDVVIDVCKKCNGMWLDSGELEKLAVIGNKMRKDAKRGRKGEKNG